MICPDPPDLEPLRQTLLYSLIGTGILLALQFIFPFTSNRIFSFAATKIAPLARKPLFCGLLLFITVVAVRVALLPRFPVPVPGIHDEFSGPCGARRLNEFHDDWFRLRPF